MFKPTVFIALFVAAWIAQNQATERHRDHFEVYGDYNAVLNQVQSEETFPRWLLGEAILTQAYRASDYLAEVSPARFLYRASMLWALASSVALLIAFPCWAAYMALTCPMLLLFGSGYPEYYPFIAPLFAAAALAHVDARLDGLAPWATGALCATLLLLYVGFLPLALVIGAYAIKRNPQSTPMIALAGLVTLAVVGFTIAGPGYLTQLLHDLNTGDLPAYPEQDGWAIPGTPFFWPAKAFESLPGLFSAISRGVGIGPMLAACVLAFHRRRLAILLGVYVLVSAFTVPRLGWLGDTDLFFQLYVLVGLSIGSALDAAVNSPKRVIP